LNWSKKRFSSNQIFKFLVEEVIRSKNFMKAPITTFLFIACLFGLQNVLLSQTYCGPATPTYTVDLTGQPNGNWISPVITRDDTCCGSTSPDKCLQFIITLDPAAQGISFNLYSGAVPPGAMFYQINCGALITVGSPICLSGAGPHYLTFCKPGNNSNEYIITSLSVIGTKGDTMAMGCTGGTLSSWGYHEPSITWTSIAPGAPGAYNSYLSCTSGCDTVVVTPLPSSPPYIDYQICGFKATLCDTIPICDTVRIYVFSTLQVIVSGSSILCYSSLAGSLTATPTGGAAPYSYSWSNGSNGQSISGLAPGTYSVNIVDANGCAISGSGTIIQPPPLVVAVSQSDALCFGDQNGTASVSPSGGTSPYTYLWLSCGCTTSGLTGLAAGSYFVTVSDQNGCSVSNNITVGQPAPMALNISSTNNVICNGGNNGQASASTSGGIAPYTYVWNTSPVQNTQTASGLTAGNYIVTVFDNNGCSKMVACSITQPPAFSSTISSIPVTCFGNSNGSTSVVASGGSPPYSYLWNPGGAVTASVSGLSSGNYSVMITDAYGCTHTNATFVSQPIPLSATITNIQNVSCYGLSNGSASVNGDGGTAPYQYLWSNGQITPGAGGLASGIVSVIVTDAKGCVANASAIITEPGEIYVTNSPNDTICPGNVSIISASAIGGVTPFTYFWQPNVGFGGTQAVNPNVTTTYTVIITDSNGCTSTGTSSVIVYNITLGVVLNATPSICIGQSATLSAAVSGSNITLYSWSNNLGTGKGPFVVSPAVTTTYSVVVTNVCGATAVSVATVVVHPLPKIDVPPQAAMECGSVLIQFSDTNTTNLGSSYLWNFGDGSTSSQPNPAHTYYQTGVYTVGVIVTSPFGCVFSAQDYCTVTVFPKPVANFTSEPGLETSIINPDFHFFDQSTNTNSWSWDFGDGQTSSLENPSHVYSQVGVYTVKLVTTNTGGCLDSITKTVEVKPQFTFYIPNTFTPNGDHINDFFTGKGLEIIEFEMSIFDRWGEEIFKTNDLDIGWDGTVRGGSVVAQEDVYVYKVKLRDFDKAQHVYTGHVNLVK
jgi:gliding motility-associated-like protein